MRVYNATLFLSYLKSINKNVSYSISTTITSNLAPLLMNTTKQQISLHLEKIMTLHTRVFSRFDQAQLKILPFSYHGEIAISNKSCEP
jgi:hypothetical protein